MIAHWLDLLETYLAHPTAVRALAAGLVTSWLVTQGWKFHPWLSRLTPVAARWYTRGIAFVTGFGPVATLWPEHGAPRWMLAVVIGIAAPILYTLALRIVGHWWPWLANAASARPDT